MSVSRTERVFESASVSIVRLNGRPRDVASGRHKELVAYVGATASTADLVRVFRDTAERLARTLPKAAE